MGGSFIQRDIPNHYSYYLNMLAEVIEEMVDYAEHIFTSLSNSKWNESKYSPVFTTFMHFIDIADSIASLIRIGNRMTTNILLRSLFEAGLSLIYMIESPVEKGVIAYKVAYAHSALTEMRKSDKKEQAGKEFINKYEQFTGQKFQSKDFNSQAAPLLNYLSKPTIKEVDQEYKKMKKNSRTINWYSVFDGPVNLEKLAEKVEGMWPIYQFVYKEGSKDVHGSATLKNISFSEEESFLPGVRNPSQIEQEGSFSISLIFKVYHHLTFNLEHQDHEALIQWYALNIKERHKLFVKDINFTVEYE